MQANVSNSWLEGDFTLVNEISGDQYYFSRAFEYYSGVEDGERWSEGSPGATVTLNNIKQGRYHLNMQLTNDGRIAYNQLSIFVVENVSLMSNFFITLLCIVIFPALIVYRKRRFDRKQWYNSNYSPYTYED